MSFDRPRSNSVSLDDEWYQFLVDSDNMDNINITPSEYLKEEFNIGTDEYNEMIEPIDGNIYSDTNTINDIPDKAPQAGPINISTKSQIVQLTHPLDIETLFWELPVQEFHERKAGIIKQVCKLKLSTPDEVNKLQNKINRHPRAISRIVSSKELTESLVDTQIKITIGLSDKDITKKSRKQTNAFLNSISLTYRFEYEGKLTEIHAKMFNTGKIKIPGIKSNDMFLKVTHDLLGILKKIIPDIEYINKPVNVIINSDFVCGFFIDRDKFNAILKNKYNLQTVYVPWYPGINCKFYYDLNDTTHNGQSTINTIENKPISIMIFRTGRVLIVGKCDECLIHYIYKFISDIIRDEYLNIRQVRAALPVSAQIIFDTGNSNNSNSGINSAELKKSRKRRRKTITIDTNLL